MNLCKKSRFHSILCFPVFISVFLISCQTAPPPALRPEPYPEVPKERVEVPSGIMGEGLMSEERLVSFFLENNPQADSIKVRRIAGFYIVESRVEGVNADVAFVQMCLETGFLRFGGLVTENMNNFCGLGSIGPGQPGNSFPDEETGIRAHVQHLKAYGSAEPLKGVAVDPRYKYVNPKGKSPLIQGLAGTWASDPEYGTKLTGLLERLYS